MQRMILVPPEQYDRLLNNYDEVKTELQQARKQLSDIYDNADIARCLRLLQRMSGEQVQATYLMLLSMNRE